MKQGESQQSFVKRTCWYLQTPISKNPRDINIMWQSILIDYVLCSQRLRNSIQSELIIPAADCASDHELFIAEFRLKLRKLEKTTRTFRYDINEILYTMEVTNSFKGLYLLYRVPEELWIIDHNIVYKAVIITIWKKKKCKKSKWLPQEALQIAEERRHMKGMWERETYS